MSQRARQILADSYIEENLATANITLDKATNGLLDLTTIKDESKGSPVLAVDSKTEDNSYDFLVEATIKYEMAMFQSKVNSIEYGTNGEIAVAMDARENFYSDDFTKEEPLSQNEFNKANEFSPNLKNEFKQSLYLKYKAAKKASNNLLKSGAVKDLSSKTEQELFDMYNKYGKEDVYAYANIVKPIVMQMSKNLATNQEALLKARKLQARKGNKDVSVIQAYLMTGSTIPSNHPSSQGLARMLEAQYKEFINEKRQVMNELSDVTDALYKEKLGFTSNTKIFNIKGVKESIEGLEYYKYY